MALEQAVLLIAKIVLVASTLLRGLEDNLHVTPARPVPMQTRTVARHHLRLARSAPLDFSTAIPDRAA